MKKGDFLITKNGKTVCKIIGKWGSDFILENINEVDVDVMLYGDAELQRLIEEGTFRKFNPTGIKVQDSKAVELFNGLIDMVEGDLETIGKKVNITAQKYASNILEELRSALEELEEER
ncbi:hypothetical protein [Youngiibacter fragilis]|uniref:Uncharacterized protein n=1 Tax=Youngiibacter fragilis 232.1 TaxID=994573 RepID=V7I3L1_9CLOT|nr:hypothetical protein [Youngiibacter fragilis]ETA80458.1 hypothetical protein T472_0211890 [Youngiibacter fragilis 232.1]